MDHEAYKDGQRKVWALGDYAVIARRFEEVADELVAAAGVRPGHRVLDVAAGTGNVALAAKAAGAEVVASDLTPALIEIGLERTGDGVRWFEADAEDLPFADGEFDVVLSCFGLIFAPRPEVAIAEAFRVVRDGGVVGLAAWTPEGATGRFSRTSGKYVAGPGGGYDAMNWGDETLARERLAPHAAEVRVEHAVVTWSFPSLDQALAESERTVGGLVAARASLPPDRYQAMTGDLRELMGELNEADDGSLRYDAEYLRIVATKR